MKLIRTSVLIALAGLLRQPRTGDPAQWAPASPITALERQRYPATGLYHFQFILYDALYGGSQQGATELKNDVPVTNGLFTVELDFGASVFTGDARWLEISVRPGASSDFYTALAPRQALTPTPHGGQSVRGRLLSEEVGRVKGWQHSPK